MAGGCILRYLIDYELGAFKIKILCAPKRLLRPSGHGILVGPEHTPEAEFWGAAGGGGEEGGEEGGEAGRARASEACTAHTTVLGFILERWEEMCMTCVCAHSDFHLGVWCGKDMEGDRHAGGACLEGSGTTQVRNKGHLNQGTCGRLEGHPSWRVFRAFIRQLLGPQLGPSYRPFYRPFYGGSVPQSTRGPYQSRLGRGTERRCPLCQPRDNLLPVPPMESSLCGPPEAHLTY